MRQDVRGTAQEKELEQFQARLGKLKASLAEAKKIASQQEQRFVSRKLQAEGLELVKEVQGEVSRTEQAAAQLLDGQSFLVRGNVQRLSGLVQELIGKGSSKELLFQRACAEGSLVTQESFRAFVAWISGEDEGSAVLFLSDEIEAGGLREASFGVVSTAGHVSAPGRGPERGLDGTGVPGHLLGPVRLRAGGVHDRELLDFGWQEPGEAGAGCGGGGHGHAAIRRAAEAHAAAMSPLG